MQMFRIFLLFTFTWQTLVPSWKINKMMPVIFDSIEVHEDMHLDNAGQPMFYTMQFYRSTWGLVDATCCLCTAHVIKITKYLIAKYTTMNKLNKKNDIIARTSSSNLSFEV